MFIGAISRAFNASSMKSALVMMWANLGSVDGTRDSGTVSDKNCSNFLLVMEFVSYSRCSVDIRCVFEMHGQELTCHEYLTNVSNGTSSQRLIFCQKFVLTVRLASVAKVLRGMGCC
jgi:hypothetical protein